MHGRVTTHHFLHTDKQGAVKVGPLLVMAKTKVNFIIYYTILYYKIAFKIAYSYLNFRVDRFSRIFAKKPNLREIVQKMVPIFYALWQVRENFQSLPFLKSCSKKLL